MAPVEADEPAPVQAAPDMEEDDEDFPAMGPSRVMVAKTGNVEDEYRCGADLRPFPVPPRIHPSIRGVDAVALEERSHGRHGGVCRHPAVPSHRRDSPPHVHVRPRSARADDGGRGNCSDRGAWHRAA